MHFLETLWAKQPGDYFCISTKSVTGSWQDRFFKRKDFKYIEPTLEEFKSHNLYFCPHGFNKPRRIKANAVAPKLLFSDLDEVDPRRLRIRPTIAIESSPGRHVGLWLTDKPINEDLNRRLVYKIGADKSGWDFSQVLRIPGTRNFKYEGNPRVKLMWEDGPKYAINELSESLPPVKSRSSGADTKKEGLGGTAQELYKKHRIAQRDLFLRKELLHGIPVEGKRSEVFHKILASLYELGIPEEDIRTLADACPWNKFKGKNDYDAIMEREMAKAQRPTKRKSLSDRRKKDEVEDELWSSNDDFHEDGTMNLHEISLAEAEEENLEWLYYPYIAMGELTIIDGDPQVGKSYFAQMIAKAICDGSKLPCVRKYQRRQGKVLYFDMENSAGTVTKKRMKWNEMVHYENFIQVPVPFSPMQPEARAAVYRLIEKYKPLMIAFDTIMTYMGGADIHNAGDTAQIMSWFRRLASRYGCGVVVLRHLKKDTKGSALYRGTGSIAFVGMARSVITVGYHPEDKDIRVAALTKASNIKRDQKVATFEIESLPDTLSEQDRSHLVWGDLIEMDADTMLQANAKMDDKKQEDNPFLAFVQGVIDDEGKLRYSELKKRAEAWCKKEGHTMNLKRLERAVQKLGIVKKGEGASVMLHAGARKSSDD